MLETVEATIQEYYGAEKNNSGSNGSSDSAKRRRDGAKVSGGGSTDDGNFMESTGRSKKRVTKKANISPQFVDFSQSDYYDDSLNDPDFDPSNFDNENNFSDPMVDQNGGRVLPSWSMPLP